MIGKYRDGTQGVCVSVGISVCLRWEKDNNFSTKTTVSAHQLWKHFVGLKE